MNNYRCEIFDYQYKTGSNKRKNTRRFTVISFTSDTLLFPDFELIPENFFHRVASVFGYQDIDFDGFSGVFPKVFTKGEDVRTEVRDLFNTELIEFLSGLQSIFYGIKYLYCSILFE